MKQLGEFLLPSGWNPSQSKDNSMQYFTRTCLSIHQGGERQQSWDEVSCLRYETIDAVALGQVLKPKVEIRRPTINAPYLDPLSPQVLLKVLYLLLLLGEKTWKSYVLFRGYA